MTGILTKQNAENKFHGSYLVPGGLFTLIISTLILTLPEKDIIGSYKFIVGICGIFCSMILLSFTNKFTKKIFYTILFFALVSRILFALYYPASDDIHRYIWEGEIQKYGHNPFSIPPNSEKLEHLRNENWHGINHKNLPTIYWPVYQLIFKGLITITSSPLLFKFLFILFDIGTFFLLVQLVLHLKGALPFTMLYLLNPLVYVCIAGEGHNESVLLFFLIASILCYLKKKYTYMYILLGLSTLCKFTPIILLPLLVNRNTYKHLPFFLLPFLLFIPYIDSSNILSVPTHFVKDFHHNGLIFSILNTVFSLESTLILCFSIAFFSAISIFFFVPNTLRAIYLILGTLLLTSPTVHPWYFLLITPFLAIYQSKAWLTIHLSSLLLLFYFQEQTAHTFWQDKTLLMTLEYVPFIVLTMVTLFKNKISWPYSYTPVKKLSVVIPTYNEESHIQRCLNALIFSSYVHEIIVVDGGSTDKTRDIVNINKPVKLLSSSRKGRGFQIYEGVQVVNGDVVLVLHADSQIDSKAFQEIPQYLNTHSSASGGCFGAKYDSDSGKFKLSTILNYIRARIVGISFGDQGQFFRTEVIKQEFPQYMLMEDVELSFRLKENGPTLFLPSRLISSTRMWNQSGYIKNFFIVLYLFTRFTFQRKFGLITHDCSNFYKIYYNLKKVL